MARKKKTIKTKKKKTSNPLAFLKNEKFSKIVGLAFILFSVILLFSMISFFPNWQKDEIIQSVSETKNWIGIAGRSLSVFFIKNLFGISSILFVLLFFVYGFRLLYKTQLLPIIKTTFLSLFVMLWLSVFFGYLSLNFNVDSLFAGAIGYETSKWLSIKDWFHGNRNCLNICFNNLPDTILQYYIEIKITNCV